MNYLLTALRILKFNTIIFLLTLLFLNLSNANEIIGKPYVVDGDTIKIKNYKIRFFGIDAPEIKQTCLLSNKKWKCGKESKNFLINIIGNQHIRCVILGKDIYKRFICECFIKERNINQLMVRKGWAIAYRKYSKKYIFDEIYAQSKKNGIWKSIFENPWDYRKNN